MREKDVCVSFPLNIFGTKLPFLGTELSSCLSCLYLNILQVGLFTEYGILKHSVQLSCS